MKLVEIGKTKIKYTKKDGTEGIKKVTPEALAQAKSIGVGKLLSCKWSADYKTITSIEEYKPKSSGGYNGKSGGGYENMVERSVFASISGIVQAMITAKLVTAKSVQKTIEGLYSGCLTMVRGKAEEKKETASDDEFGESKTEDTEFGKGDEPEE